MEVKYEKSKKPNTRRATLRSGQITREGLSKAFEFKSKSLYPPGAIDHLVFLLRQGHLLKSLAMTHKPSIKTEIWSFTTEFPNFILSAPHPPISPIGVLSVPLLGCSCHFCVIFSNFAQKAY